MIGRGSRAFGLSNEYYFTTEFGSTITKTLDDLLEKKEPNYGHGHFYLAPLYEKWMGLKKKQTSKEGIVAAF